MRSGERAFDPVFWERLWLEALVSSPVARRDRFGPAEKLAHWDRRAEGYARQSESAESRARRAELLRWLGSRGALQARFRVLDIGAGPGNFALPLATRVRQVTALEPAPGMAAILRRRQAARGLRNIRVVERGWGEVELGRVFERYTPLTPAVRRRIGDYVWERTRGGRFRQAGRQCQGFLLWEAGSALTA